MKSGVRYVRVSYDLEPLMPVFAGNPPNRMEKKDSFENGAAWNSFLLTLFNHNGTHIDAPNHFDPRGRTICDYALEDFVFVRPCLVDVPKEAGAPITADDLAAAGDRDCDVLLIRTGFSRMRKDDAYVGDNPWLEPGAAACIRERFTNLKALGVDTVSIASCRHPEEGGDAHRILLRKGNYPGMPPVIIEDLNLGLLPAKITRFYAVPLFACDVDSMPCTAFAEIES
jgi:kynurenine formamidase